ncbi:MAG TPA: oxidoreductase [Methanocorpusculum sp.]|nr:oxidoreductase [Methanocorpusculum sp.]
MTGCVENPAVPCAMTGACAVLSGIEGLSVIIHGASGCYFYPKSVLRKPIYSTMLLESEIVMGTVGRLREVIGQLGKTGRPVAVINTCIPALTGDDLSPAFADGSALFVDAPGYIGNAETGVKIAYDALNIWVSETRPGVNIDGVLGLDLFARGNLHEAERILALLGIPCALRLAADTYDHIRAGAAPYSVSVNPSWNAGIGDTLGSFLFPDLGDTAENLAEKFPNANIDALTKEWEHADEVMFHYADKFLRKFTPPTVAIAAQNSYCRMTEKMLTRYFGSDILAVFPREEVTDSAYINTALQEEKPDLLLGSSFEATAAPAAAFVGITHPDRSKISIAAPAMTGIEGGIAFMERCLNALMDAKREQINL